MEGTLPPERAARGPSLILVGTDYRHAPLEVRERLSYAREEAADALVHLLARPEVAEACLISTCNRTEVYLQPRDDEAAYSAAVDHIFASRVEGIERSGRLYVKRHDVAADHLLAVASGLESMVLGEPEILGQVKQAASLADEVGASGTVLQRLLRAALDAGRRARGETGIAAGAVSFAYATVELARNVFSSLERTRVLLVGAGDVAQQVARNLAERGAREVTIANRSRERAEVLRADVPQLRIVPFESRFEAFASHDLVVVSVSTEEAVITAAEVERACDRRGAQPLLLVDLGMPRNVEPKVGQLGNVFLHDLDSLQHLIQRNLKRRRDEVPRVREIIEEELKLFFGWFHSREAEPLVARLQKQAEAVRLREVAAVLDRFPADTHAELERLTRTLVRKLLHHPSTGLRREEVADRSRLELVRELFKLDDGEG